MARHHSGFAVKAAARRVYAIGCRGGGIGEEHVQMPKDKRIHPVQRCKRKAHVFGHWVAAPITRPAMRKDDHQIGPFCPERGHCPFRRCDHGIKEKPAPDRLCIPLGRLRRQNAGHANAQTMAFACRPRHLTLKKRGSGYEGGTGFGMA